MQGRSPHTMDSDESTSIQHRAVVVKSLSVASPRVDGRDLTHVTVSPHGETLHCILPCTYLHGPGVWCREVWVERRVTG